MNIKDKFSKTARENPPSGIRKFWDLAQSMDNVISLCVGEPDFQPPKVVIDDCCASLHRGETKYVANYGLLPLRHAISEWYEKKYGVHYGDKEMMITLGASEAIDLALRTIVNPGDEILIPDPAYVAYAALVKLCGGVPVMVPTYLEQDFKVTAEELKKYITPKTKALLMSYPCNPTGAILNKSDLESIAKVIIDHDLLVISDEIYSELTYEGHHVSAASIPGMKDRTVILNGFSKAFAMTGLRIGYMCGHADLVETALRIHQYSIVSPATPVQHCAITALKECDGDAAAMREEYRARRDLIVKGFQDMGLPIAVPQGAFYVFPDISQTGLDDFSFCEQLLKQQHVAVVPGSAFGECGRGRIRCSYASSRETIEEALTRIDKFLKSLT